MTGFMPHVRKPEFHRFRDLTDAMLNVDFQIHTNWTDGEATPQDILEVAQARHLDAIAFTEHIRHDTDWFARFVRHVREHAVGFPDMTVYVGCETTAMDENGTIDSTDDIHRECDLVLGSVHRFPDGKGGYLDFKALSAGDAAEIEFLLALGLARHAAIDVLAHPGGMYERRHGAFPQEYFRELMMATLERGIAIEINSSYLVDMGGFLLLCEEINPIVSIGSDVHRLDDLARCRDMLRQLGVARV
ncbi:PHP domain-containing protein [Rhizobiaceae bacterium n13]|uniref:PHP domain-containing protein n=1 Tax=Ferirhizobium litorale TaxID=2927786 RepID=A0AAE3U2V5_9HYPH|nr:PHP domain-containing protein [Fererhizobium litorale]MDI7864806.1 PHP domain-containing protein [Fererhizobium litorale]MDI7921718.1 PHP domain-containing protein [Fererhizobium litorale]